MYAGFSFYNIQCEYFHVILQNLRTVQETRGYDVRE